MAKLGKALTVTETLAVLVQASVPVTVYINVPDKLDVTTTRLPVFTGNPPPVDALHVYVLAPSAVNVELAPIQIDDGLGFTVTVGLGFTVKITVCAALVQLPLVPVTV